MSASVVARLEAASHLICDGVRPPGRSDLSSLELDIVVHVPATEPRSLTWLAEHFAIPPATCMSIVRRLEWKGYVTRVADRPAARRLTVQLASKGRQVVSTHSDLDQERVSSALDRLTPDERGALIPLVEHAAEAATDLVRQSGRLPISGFATPHRGFGSRRARTAAARGERAAMEQERWGTLTATERRVAEMVRMGMDNAEIGSALTISPRTVDSHLFRIYAKLGIASRARLLAEATAALASDSASVRPGSSRSPGCRWPADARARDATRFCEAWSILQMRLMPQRRLDHTTWLTQALARESPRALTAVAAACDVPLSACLSIARDLERRGDVSIGRADDDRRRLAVRLTPKGRQEVPTTFRLVDPKMAHHTLRSIDMENRLLLVSLLEKLGTAMVGADAGSTTPALERPARPVAAEPGRTADELGPITPSGWGAADWEALTPREQEVAALVQQGLANADIADRLLIGRGTVATHLRHLYAKLGVTSRSRLSIASASAPIRPREAGAPSQQVSR